MPCLWFSNAHGRGNEIYVFKRGQSYLIVRGVSMVTQGQGFVVLKQRGQTCFKNHAQRLLPGEQRGQLACRVMTVLPFLRSCLIAGTFTRSSGLSFDLSFRVIDPHPPIPSPPLPPPPPLSPSRTSTLVVPLTVSYEINSARSPLCLFPDNSVSF